MWRYWSNIFLLLVPFSGLFAQDREFFINGTATQLNDSCFQLTPDLDTFEVGSIWYPDKVDLRNSFDLVMEMNFGCKDEFGADGIVFGLQPVSASVGRGGEGLGIGGVRPALGVEFDTYYNNNRLDPLFDHIAIMANGAVTHSGPDNLAGPVRARAGSDNIEICASLPLRVTWDASTRNLKVYFDCELRLDYTADIVNTIFGGDPFVYYGFAAATGGLGNVQSVCFTFNSFQKQLEDVTVCPGGKALLDVSGGASYEWSPAAGLNSTTAPSVEASPDSTTTYTVKIFDACGLPRLDTVRVAVAGDSAFVQLGPDTTLCPGESLDLDVSVPTATYTWSDSTLRGPVVTLTDPGIYSVTATRTDIICTAADRIVVEAYALPDFDIGPADTSLCTGDTLLIDGVYPHAQAFVEGQPFDTLEIRTPDYYTFTLEHPCITQVDAIEVSLSSCREYYLPTAFSPNGDGTNDRFFPLDGGDILLVRRFTIFDRWGAVVFDGTDLTSNTPELGWDGRVGERDAPIGTYVWTMEADFRSGQRSVERGAVQLVR
ncbi:lectin-like domain-containing protein [Neolewinella sp.]|uniref:lectin-like domain-containing protein n=1 Tax=Neolewinella sp. TaxID=2993543 RepID=UPI003B517207